jgi:integrase/recombinase XerD
MLPCNLALCDRALFMLPYNSGARVQEIADLRVGDVDLEPPLRARLHSKGDTWRRAHPTDGAMLKRSSRGGHHGPIP